MNGISTDGSFRHKRTQHGNWKFPEKEGQAQAPSAQLFDAYIVAFNDQNTTNSDKYLQNSVCKMQWNKKTRYNRDLGSFRGASTHR